MTKPIPKIVHNAIHSIFYDSYNICRPKIAGSQNNVYFLDSSPDTFVFKFNNRGLVQKNEAVSKILSAHGVPVPQISAFEYDGVWFELYKRIPGKTLYEWIGEDMESDTVKTAYKNIIESIAKMSKIDTRQLPPLQYKYTHQVAKSNISNVNNPLMGNVFQLLVRMLNYGSANKIGLYHSGMTPKNIVVSDTGQLTGILDIDEAAICNQNYAFASMAAKYEQLGYDITELFDYYENITGQPLNRTAINAQVNLNNFGKKLLWMASSKGRSGK